MLLKATSTTAIWFTLDAGGSDSESEGELVKPAIEIGA